MQLGHLQRIVLEEVAKSEGGGWAIVHCCRQAHPKTSETSWYRALKGLVEKGLVTKSSTDKPHPIYSLTAAGEGVLKA